jgi:7-carboxy-7-deazaguanine synthase
MSTETLTITEIYGSIQGESTHAGFPCTFVRLTGCPLRCRWCDTVHSFKGGNAMTIEQILAEVREIGLPWVELTGGEPLAQPQTPALAKALVDEGYKVMIETSGSEPVKDLHEKVHIVMDLKAPASGMSDRNLWANLDWLKPTDDIKFVLADRADFDWAMEKIGELRLSDRFNVLLSCAFGLLQPKDLAAWMVERKLDCRLQLQQHKYIWHPRAKGV